MVTKQALVKWVDGLRFVGKAYSNHAIVMDAVAEVGGGESGLRPGEMVLLALAGCTGMDVVSLLKKMRVAFDAFEIAIDAEVAENYPKRFTKITVVYRVRGRDIPADKLQRAIDLSRETYCSVSAQLRPGAEINYRYEILPPESQT